VKIKKLLIVKPRVEEIFDDSGNVIGSNYIYPDKYNPEHAQHICYNFANRKNLKGGHIAEGMVIYEAEEKEIKILLKEKGIEEIDYDNAKIKGKKWKPKNIIEGIEKPEFDITEWIKKSEIDSNKL